MGTTSRGSSQVAIRSEASTLPASGQLSWRLVLAAQAVGALVNLLRYLQEIGTAESERHLLLTMIFTIVGAFLIVLASVYAAEASRHGASAFRCYTLALLMASGSTALVDSISQQLLYPHTGGPDLWAGFGLDFVYLVAIGGIAMLAYHNRQRMTQILQGIRAAELKQVELERGLIESRLATAQAEIDPRVLFASLTSIRCLYAASAPAADRELDLLIEELRRRRVASGAAPVTIPR